MEKNWKFGRGIYGSKDAPIKLLDKMIAGIVILILALSLIFAINGGYLVSFETGEASVLDENVLNSNSSNRITIKPQKLRYGQLVQEPEIPIKPGYEFVTWVTSEDATLAEEWNFVEDRVEGDMTLYAVWKKTT